MRIDKIYDVAVVGAGPAGMTAAIYAKRAQLDTILFDHGAPGGKVVTTAFVENYPGFKYIEGPELASHMFEQVLNLGIEFVGREVLEIGADGKYKTLTTKKGVVKAKTIIIASGTQNRKLGIPGEEKYENHGVAYCAICDGNIYKNKPIAVVGGGNSAVEEAIYLSGIVNSIKLIQNGPELTADPVVITHAKQNSKIEIITNTETVEIIGDGKKVNGLKVKNTITGKEEVLDVDGVFVFIGLIPKHVKINQADIIDNNSGYNKVNDDMETIIPGVYSAGDINNKKYRQIATAINDGTIAALNAKNYINNNF